MKILNLITKNHTKTKRKFIDRMIDNKIEAMKIARLYSKITGMEKEYMVR